MSRTVTLVASALLLAAFASTSASAQIIDPAVHNLERLTPLQFGSEENPASMEPREYKLKVGKGYRLKISASDLNEYAFVAPAFFRNIYIRKIEVGDVEIKAPTLDEIEFEKGGEAAVVESVKAASDVYAPVSGRVTEVNDELPNSPEVINQDPYGDGWMLRMEVDGEDEIEELMSAAEYEELIGELS